jgi:hypothetical protein
VNRLDDAVSGGEFAGNFECADQITLPLNSNDYPSRAGYEHCCVHVENFGAVGDEVAKRVRIQASGQDQG